MSVQPAYVCHIQTCNVLLLLLGLGAIGLAGSQFSRVSLENYRDIDLRLLNWIHVLSGLIGMYTVMRNHGSIVAKTLYCVSIVVGIASAVFYGITTYRVMQNHRELLALEHVDGFEQEYSGTRAASVGKIAISAVMIGVSALAALIAVVASLILDRLVIVVQPSWPSPINMRDPDATLKWARARLTSISAIKLLLGLGTLGLAAFLEYEHELDGGNDNYIKIALDHIAAMLAVCSAVIDLYAVFGNRQTVLNFKVSIAASVIAAVWCLKSVDYLMFPFYKNDLKAYRTINTLDEPSLSQASAPRFIIVVVEGVLIGCFAVLFFVSTFTAVQAASCFHSDLNPAPSYFKIDRSLVIQNRCLGCLHIFWGFCLMALVVLGLIPADWNSDFIGGDMLWLAVLFITTGLISSSNINSLTTCRFVLSTVCVAVSLEKLCVSVNLIYQSATFSDYLRSPQQQYIGRIVLNSVQTGVLAAEAITALSTVVTFGTVISRMTSIPRRHANGPHLFFSLGILFYGVLFTGSYVIFELGKWRYAEMPLENPFFRHGNGPIALAAYIVQVACSCSQRLLLPAAILQVIVAALALFVISPTMTNVYYLFSTLSADEVLRTSGNQHVFLQVAIILTAVCALAAVIATVCGTIIALRTSYILHHRSSMSANSTVIAPFEDAYGTVKTIVFPRLPLQEREEQTLYWSEDENPYYYHTSKRYYGQPYQIESGFYGYALATGSDGTQQQNGAGHLHQHHHQRHSRGGRGIQSNGTQTRIGHIFDDS